MAKFCEKCGSTLVDGKCPNCKEESVEVISESANTTNSNSGFDFNKIINFFKSAFTKPIDLIKEESVESNFTTGWVVLAIGAVSMGLFIMALAKTLYSTVLSSMGGMSSLMSMSGYNVDIPYFKIFIIGAIVYLIVSAGLSGLFTLFFGKVFKGDLSFKKSFVLYQLAGIIMIVGYLCGAVLSFISVPLGLVVAFVAAILNLIYLVIGLNEESGVKKNLVGYAYVCSYAAYYLILFIISKLFS